MDSILIRKALLVVRGVEDILSTQVGEGSSVHHVVVYTDRGSIESFVSNVGELDQLVEFTENLCLGLPHTRKYSIQIKNQ